MTETARQPPAPENRPERFPAPLMPRKDLQWVRRLVRGKVRWIVRDPLTTQYVYLSTREKSFLDRLGSPPNQDPTRPDFPPSTDAIARPTTDTWQQTLIHDMTNHGLLVGHEPGFGRRLLQRSRRYRGQTIRTAAFRLLAIPIPLFDPTRLLDRLTPLGRMIFSRFSLVALVLAGLCLVLLLVGKWDSVAGRWPSMQSILSGDRLVGFAIAYVLMKTVHELSHAVACRRFGGECHEIGLFLLAFTPCLYCDVSDMWKVSDKFSRVLVAAAGIFAELALAIAAGFLWILTLDGPVHTIAFNLMVLGSVSTFLVNANPLLRYDGYYMFADAIDVPNLAEQSREALWTPLKGWLSDGSLAATPRDAPWWLLVSYGLLSMLYRVVVLVLILWGLHQILASWGLELLSGMLTITVVLGLSMGIYQQTRQGVRQILASGPIRPFRWLLLAGVAFFLVDAAFRFPLPHAVPAVGHVKPVDLEPLYAPRDGFLRRHLAPGAWVHADDTIATLECPEDQYRIASLEADLAELEAEIRSLNSRMAEDPELGASLTIARESADQKRQQLEIFRRQNASSRLVANTSGMLIEPARRAARSPRSRQLGRWSGSPLETANENAWIERGTLLGWVGTPNDWQVEAFVAESDVEELTLSANCRIRVDQRPGVEFLGRVAKIGQSPLREVPNVLAGDPRIPLASRGSDVNTPEQTTYRVTIRVDQALPALPHEALANIRIDGEPKSLAERLLRFIRKTFRADSPF